MRTFFYDFKAGVDLELPSRKRLFKKMGEYDTLAEYTICALRDFEKRWDGKEPFENYVTQKAIEHKVNLKGGVTLPNHEPALYKSFIINSHALLGDFIQSYKLDIKSLIEQKFKLYEDDRLNNVEKLLKSLKTKDIIPNFPKWLLPLLDYYRLLRNSTAHVEEDKNKCIKAYLKIPLEEFENDYPIFKGKAPNKPDDITMNDFYLYSASIKHFANFLTMALKGKVKWTDLVLIHPNFDINNIPKGTNIISLINSVYNKYHYCPTREEVEQIRLYIKNQKLLHTR